MEFYRPFVGLVFITVVVAAYILSYLGCRIAQNSDYGESGKEILGGVMCALFGVVAVILTVCASKVLPQILGGV